jgi:hypothetical protein
MTHRKFWLGLFILLLGGFALAGDSLLGWLSDTSVELLRVNFGKKHHI